MEKRRGRSEEEISDTLTGKAGGDGDNKGKGFFACYLLASLSPRHKGHSYIGFTVNPRRRIRQHNGEIRSGAWRTKSKRPWEMVLCIYGFPTNVSALQFEWAWQHPTESLAVRKAAASFKSLSGIANKIKLAYTMLTLPAWNGLYLTVNFFSTKYTMHCASCPSLPEHMKVRICSMDELPCYVENDQSLYENDDGWDDEDLCDRNDHTDLYEYEECTNKIVHGSAACQISTYKISNERTRRTEENGMRLPMESTVLEDHREPFYHINSPENTSSSVDGLYSTEENVKDLSVHGSAACQISTYKISNERTRRTEENGMRLPMESTVLEDHREPFDHINSPENTSSSVDGLYSTEENVKDLSGIVEEKSSFGQGWPTRKQLQVLANGQPIRSCYMSNEVEVSDERTRQTEENGARLPMESTAPEDHREPFYHINSPENISYGVNGLYSTEENVKDLPGIVEEESSFGQGLPTGKQLQVLANANEQPISSCNMSSEVEVIDILTPSPDCRIRLCSKKRRRVCPEIIDLTKSPIFVQL